MAGASGSALVCGRARRGRDALLIAEGPRKVNHDALLPWVAGTCVHMPGNGLIGIMQRAPRPARLGSGESETGEGKP
jgi:hypothetical protein